MMCVVLLSFCCVILAVSKNHARERAIFLFEEKEHQERNHLNIYECTA